MKKYLVSILIFLSLHAFAQKTTLKTSQIKITNNATAQRVDVYIGKELFTSFCYPDSLEKPFLYPIYAANNQRITRGFPLNPQPNDAKDHPHHIGLWFNYENVNGLDFWNNSYAIAADKKMNYGWIKTEKIKLIPDGTKAGLTYEASWKNQAQKVLLKEYTRFNFSVTSEYRVIERITKLVAQEPVRFPDAKDGLLGLRVAHELELPVVETKKYMDANGIATIVKANKDSSVTGNYLTSEGAQGDAAWATRGKWCMLYGKLGKDSVSIVIIDHPSNPGYPTFWHARNYGLFAANPLGQKVFSNGKNELNFNLATGDSVMFRYKIIIASGKNKLNTNLIDSIANAFANSK